MKKSVLPALLALTAIAAASVFIAYRLSPHSFAGRLTGDELFNPEDTIHLNPALFDDPVNTGRFGVAANATYKSITVYLLTGTATANGRSYVTLQNALQQKMVTVKETSQVNELAIDNLSSNYIYINSGDIVKGGKQDRTIQYDVIIAPNQQNVELASFCVEHGRWTRRGDENDKAFESSENSLSSKELKLAAKQKKSQREVWSKVEEYQGKTNDELKKGRADSMHFDIRNTYSMSSLELTLDNEHVDSLRHAYREHLAALLKKVPGATGLAYAINGKLYSIDLFNNEQLFADMADKLLDAAIAEAISEPDQQKEAPSSQKINSILQAKGKVYENHEINKLTQFQASEPDGFPTLIVFSSLDKDLQKWLHRNWLDKSKD